MDHKFEISAVLMLNEGQEDSYVSHSLAVMKSQPLTRAHNRLANCIFFRHIYALHRLTGVLLKLLFRYPPSGA